jgi:hypothetical protein
MGCFGILLCRVFNVVHHNTIWVDYPSATYERYTN